MMPVKVLLLLSTRMAGDVPAAVIAVEKMALATLMYAVEPLSTTMLVKPVMLAGLRTAKTPPPATVLLSVSVPVRLVLMPARSKKAIKVPSDLFIVRS